MLSSEYLQALSARLADAFPAARAMREDLEAEIYQRLQSSLARLNIVTREEFDAQLAALERAERTIAELEDKIERLERERGVGSVKADDQTSGS